MDELADAKASTCDDTYNYGPESYDSAIIIALAAQVAGDRRHRSTPPRSST